MKNLITIAVSVSITMLCPLQIKADDTIVDGIPYVKLNNGQLMPRFGIGTFNDPGDSIACDAVTFAFKNGYRHVDTAHAYRVERGVGKAVAECGIPRDEIWITSKIWPSEYGEGKTLEAIDRMLDRLGIEYIDLLYLHQPMGDWRGAWRDMEKAVELGKVRSLGLSNFDAADSLYDAAIEFAKIRPAVMQIECHPYAQRIHWQERLKNDRVQLECWFPLGGAMSNGALFKDPVIVKIAEAHGKTPAQIILRWHIQEGFSAIPGATDHGYITENIDIFDFELSLEEMALMRGLDKEQRFFNMDYKQAEKFMLDWKMDD
jgi:2,5-didehydrogluconate reductase